MLKTDEVTSAMLYCMGAGIAPIQGRLSEEEIAQYEKNPLMTNIRLLCKVRSAIMLRKPGGPQKDYPLQIKICPQELFEQVVRQARESFGYVRDNDFTNPGLYTVFSECNREIRTQFNLLLAENKTLKEHAAILKRFIANKKSFTFYDFLTEYQSFSTAKISMPWGIYTPMWHALYDDNRKAFSSLYVSDTVFLPKVYFSSGHYFDASRWSITNYSGCTKEMNRVLDTVKSSRNVSIVIDGDNTPPLLMMTLMKFMSTLKNVRAIKVVYNEDGLIRWENINIDKVTYYKSHRYNPSKNNTDLIVGAILMEEQYKGASTTILVSSDGDYINVIDMIQNSDVIVIIPNKTSAKYLDDLEKREIQVEILSELFVTSQIRELVGQDRRMSSICMLQPE